MNKFVFITIAAAIAISNAAKLGGYNHFAPQGASFSHGFTSHENGNGYGLPDNGYGGPDSREQIKILRDERAHPEHGHYYLNFETENGIQVEEKGEPLDIYGNPTGSEGKFSFTFPNGEEFKLSYTADENGFQPQSSHIPIAPEFPHEIPDFVLEQIEKAAREDAAGIVHDEHTNYNDDSPSPSYAPPSPPKRTYGFN